MPKDVDLARELAEKLNAQNLGKIKDVQFTYDTFVELDRMPKEGVVSFVSLDAYNRTRESRSTFVHETAIRFTMIAIASPNENPQWPDDALQSFDMVLDQIEDISLGNNKLLPLTLESDDRYSEEQFHTHGRLVADVLITYRNL